MRGRLPSTASTCQLRIVVLEAFVIVSKVSMMGSRCEQVVEGCAWERQLLWAASRELKVQSLIRVRGRSIPPGLDYVFALNECEKAGDYPCDHEGMKRRVQTLSCGLAEVTSDVKVVQFIHQSVKDFYLLNGLSALAGAQNPAEALASSQADLEGKAHYVLCRTCIRYLAMDEIAQSTMRDGNSFQTTDFALLHYATTSWVAHAKQSQLRWVSQDDLLRYFDWPSEALVQVWVRVYNIISPYSDDCPADGTKMIHIVSRHGLLGPLQVILQSAHQVGADIEATDNYGRTPLLQAAAEGHEAMVKLLLDKGADVESKDNDGRTPLSWAAENGHEAMVKLLLDRGADIESKDGFGRRTPLLRAAGKGHEAIVKLLLGKGADVESKDLDRTRSCFRDSFITRHDSCADRKVWWSNGPKLVSYLSSLIVSSMDNNAVATESEFCSPDPLGKTLLASVSAPQRDNNKA